jgi:DNA-binding TFAR19-related protein (PDSD5 family)
MSDAELQAIRRRKIKELQRNLANKQIEKPAETVKDDEVLNQIFRGRAWEVFNTGSQQYPQIMVKVKQALVRLARTGKLQEVTGEQLYQFLRALGVRVRLNTSISFAKDGRVKSLSEKFKDDLEL